MHTRLPCSRNGLKSVGTLRWNPCFKLALVPVRPTFLPKGPSQLYHTRSALSCPSHLRRSIKNQCFSLSRNIGWTSKFRPRAPDANKECRSDGDEDVAKDAVLEKVMKGRQLTDLMLRCKFQHRSFALAKIVF